MRKIYLSLLLVVSLSAFAQKNKLGKVTIEELKEKVHSKDTAAVAAIIFKSGKTRFDYDPDGSPLIVTEVDVKIKIYKKGGYDWATHEVPYYVSGGSSRETVNFFDAAVYNLENGAIVKTKLKSDGEFTEEVTENWRKKKIALPNVKEGSIVEYNYVIKSPFIVAFPTWDFQYAIPVNQIDYSVHMPEYYSYNSLMRGSLIPTISKDVVVNAKYKFSEARVSYSMKDVPALRDERFVNNIRNYTSLIEHELSSVRQNDGTIKKYAQTWDDVVKSIYDNDDFGRELRSTSYFEDELNAVISNAKDDDEKIALIFSFVKNRMNWNERFSYSCKNGVKRAYKEKVGDVAEINLMLTAMLRHAGFSANPIILSTRKNGIAFYPSRTAFNYVICGVEVKNKIILLDATSKNAMPDILPTRALNWFGRVIRKDGTSAEVSLTPKISSKQSINILADMDVDGKLSGKAREQYTEYNAFVFRENSLKMAKDSYLENLEKRYGGIEIEEYSTTNDKELGNPIIENYSFVQANATEKIGDKIYFSPLLHHAETENPFTQLERKYPVDFSFPYQDNYMFNITIPEGYIIETLPAPVNLAMENNLGSFKYNISSTGNRIQVKAVLDINQAVVTPESYETLKDFYKAMIEKQNEKVVLRKV